MRSRTLRVQNSISRKLMRINVLVSAVALVLASVSFLTYDAWSFRQNLLHSLATEAEIIGSNSISSITFDDPEAARTTLGALRSSPHIVSAMIVKPDNQPFASYLRDSSSPAIVPERVPADSATRGWGSGNYMLLGSRIEFRGKVVGMVYIESETTEIGQRVRRYVFIAGTILIICLLAAVALTSSMRRVIADPICTLAEIAQEVSREKDFSLRAPTLDEADEVGILVRSFNEMLSQIQERDRALTEAREVLEQRVEQRTGELQAANRELEAFSYSVAHDLRGPLDLIGNTVFLISQANASALDPQMREMLAMLPRATTGLARLIDDLLNLSRSKSATIHMEPLDLSRIAQDVVQELRASAPRRSIEVQLEPGILAIADKGLARVLLANLLGNAWKYSANVEHAKILFGTYTQGDVQIFFVRDNGAGFDPRMKHRLFKAFQRLHDQSDFAGTGIGLATVARIVERHGGRIWAEGETGKGATFYFTLA